MTPISTHSLGFKQLNPIPSDSRLTKFYESEYYHLIKAGGRANELGRLLRGGDEGRIELNWLRSTLYLDCLDAINSNSTGLGPVLDIGCGMGNLVEYLQQNGLDSEGIEPSYDAAQIAIDRGLRVQQATLEELISRPESHARYRAVTLLNVLEHVPDPVKFLADVKNIIAPGGIAVIRVPNDFTEIQQVAERSTTRKQWWVADPDHINYFSSQSIEATCKSLGLEVVEMYADFPMEFFILFGINYVDDPAQGKEAHKMRCSFELLLPKEKRREIYKVLSTIGIGRDLFVVTRRCD